MTFKFKKYLIITFVFISSSLSCSVIETREDKFLKKFPKEVANTLVNICQKFNDSVKENGIYYSHSDIDTYKIIGMNNKHYEIYQFERDWEEDKVDLTFFAEGEYIKSNNFIVLETSSKPNENLIFNHQNLLLITKGKESFLINDIDESAGSISWSQTLGRPSELLKKIECTVESINGYKGEREVAPNYNDLPSELKEYVLERPLHFIIIDAIDIRSQIRAEKNLDKSIEQFVKFKLNDKNKLFINQPVCILVGKAKGKIGYLARPEVSVSKAWFSYYKENVMDDTSFPEKGNILTTSKFECEKTKNPSEI